MIPLVTGKSGDKSVPVYDCLYLVVLLLLCLLSPGWCLCLGAGLGDWYLRETMSR